MKKKKKLLALFMSMILISGLVLGLCGCGKEETKDLKVGLICLEDSNTAYSKNFIEAMDATKEKLGLSDDQVILKTNVSDVNTQDVVEAAEDLIDRGCTLIIGNSFGYDTPLSMVAKDHPNIQVVECTGTLAHTSGAANSHNAFAHIYQARYLTGMIAGEKLNELIKAGEITEDEAKLGYVGAYAFAEVISGYTAFYLGAKSVCPSATMDVQFTGSWGDEALDKETARALIDRGCKVLACHSDSNGMPLACEEAGVYHVAYNYPTDKICPNSYLASCQINWEPFFTYAITCMKEGKPIETDWCGGFEEGSLNLKMNTDLISNEVVDEIEQTRAMFLTGQLEVFNCGKFTVKGETITSYKADVDTDADYTPDTEVIEDGVFKESKFRSAPYFDIKTIDGINLLNEKM